MAEIERKNFSQLPPDQIPKYQIYRRCNFMKPQPATTGDGTATGVRLFPSDDTPRTFVECNLFNCEPPPGSVVSGCNTWIVARGVPSTTKEDEVVEVDGVEVSRETFTDQVAYARWTTQGYEYITPRVTPENY